MAMKRQHFKYNVACDNWEPCDVDGRLVAEPYQADDGFCLCGDEMKKFFDVDTTKVLTMESHPDSVPESYFVEPATGDGDFVWVYGTDGHRHYVYTDPGLATWVEGGRWVRVKQ